MHELYLAMIELCQKYDITYDELLVALDKVFNSGEQNSLLLIT